MIPSIILKIPVKVTFCFWMFFISLFSLASSATEQNYQAVTAKDVYVDKDELEFALMPLTRSELAVEVDAWFILLKEAATIVSEAEILVSVKQKRIEKAEDIAQLSADSVDLLQQKEQSAATDKALKEELSALNDEISELKTIDKTLADRKTPEVSSTSKNNTEKLEQLSEKAEQYTERQQKRRTILIRSLTQLREKKNDVLERFNLVLEQWELKGGETTEFTQYAEALSGTKVDITDSDTAWLTIKEWLLSKDGGLRWLANFIKFFVAIMIVLLFSKIVGRIADAALSRNKNFSFLLKSFIQTSVRRVIVIIGFIVALPLIEINVGPVLALIGAAGLVVGLALQGTLSNFASGMLILIYRPFDVDDIIEIDGVTGVVHSMTLLSTAIKTFDNQHLVIPNNNIWGTTIINVTGSKTRRVDLVFGIGYSDDMAKAQKIMEDILADHEHILAKPEPMIKVHELGDSSVNFICRPWVKTEHYWDVYWDVTRSVKEQFDLQGISIPFPQRDVHLHQIAP